CSACRASASTWTAVAPWAARAARARQEAAATPGFSACRACASIRAARRSVERAWPRATNDAVPGPAHVALSVLLALAAPGRAASASPPDPSPSPAASTATADASLEDATEASSEGATEPAAADATEPQAADATEPQAADASTPT